MSSSNGYSLLLIILLISLSIPSGIHGNEAVRNPGAPEVEKGGPIEGPGPKPDPVPESHLEKMIVFTANQEFLSRIYLLRMDGTVYKYFEFFAYRFVDVEVIDNELYAAEAFAPRVYKVDLYTGDLEVIIDDWSLYYFYGLCFDGTYFYLDEWDFRRYDINGNFKGSVSFSDPVYGSAWDGEYLWIQGDANRIKCWDISRWPLITEVPSLHFTPPSPNCRGLWYDGQYFWTAESIEQTLGMIYRFDHTGAVVDQWLEPAYQGWGACTVMIEP